MSGKFGLLNKNAFKCRNIILLVNRAGTRPGFQHARRLINRRRKASLALSPPADHADRQMFTSPFFRLRV